MVQKIEWAEEGRDRHPLEHCNPFVKGSEEVVRFENQIEFRTAGDFEEYHL
jgi:hypothetical protein